MNKGNSGLILAALAMVAVQTARAQQSGSVAAATAPAVLATSGTSERALLDQYCVGCHNQRLKTAGLMLDQLDVARMHDHPEIWEKVVRKLRAGMMPPAGMRRPDAPVFESMISFMEKELDHDAVPNLTPPGMHRLNRTEYTNAIRDVLGLQVDATKFLPPDDSTHGFDNIAGALTLSPALMEAYLSAAGKISRLAVGDVSAPTQAVFEVPSDTAQNYHIEGLPFGTRGGILIKYQFPADGEYTFKVKGVTGYFQAVLGSVKGEQLEVTVDGERAKLFDWDKEISTTTGNGRATQRIPVKAGLHTVGVTFLATNDVPGSELNKPFQRTMNTPGSIPGFLFYPHVGQVWIEGPYNAAGASGSQSRKRIFVCRPATSRDEAACAHTILSTLAKHAYRRPPTTADLAALTEFYQTGRSGGGSFDDGIEAALQRVLVDPEFVYRSESEPAGLPAGNSYRVSDLALASRLSFFLWSSVPDDELIDLAAQGKLKDQRVLETQVRRMLADPKSEALITNFTGQWLGVRSLKTSEPVVNLFPDFDDNLRAAYQNEIELFFGSVVRRRSQRPRFADRGLHLRKRAAGEAVRDPEHLWPAVPRGDIAAGTRHAPWPAGQGSAIDSRRRMPRALRLSPEANGSCKRSSGVSPPDPPPNVPALKDRPVDSTGNAKAPTMRQTMEAHRANPVCASCHKIFEPIGLALENFDAVGAWRTEDGDSPIDASGVLVDGTKVDGVASLRDALVRRSDQFMRVVTEKMLTYALGRGIEYQDMPLVRSIVRDSARSNYKFSSIVLGIVKSPPFQTNMKVARQQPGAGGQIIEERRQSCLSPRNTFRAGRFCAAAA